MLLVPFLASCKYLADACIKGLHEDYVSLVRRFKPRMMQEVQSLAWMQEIMLLRQVEKKASVNNSMNVGAGDSTEPLHLKFDIGRMAQEQGFSSLSLNHECINVQDSQEVDRTSMKSSQCFLDNEQSPNLIAGDSFNSDEFSIVGAKGFSKTSFFRHCVFCLFLSKLGLGGTEIVQTALSWRVPVFPLLVLPKLIPQKFVTLGLHILLVLVNLEP